MYDYNIVKENLENLLKDNNKNKPLAFIMIGLPASGKSTLIEKLKVDFGITEVLSVDDLAEKYAKEHDLSYKSVIITNFKQFKQEMYEKAEYIKNNKVSFIWDQVNSNKNIRQEKVGMYKNNFHVIGIAMNPTTDEMITRMINRKMYTEKDLSSGMLCEMANLFSQPTLDEGFKEILIVGKEIVRLSENPDFIFNKLDLSKANMDKQLVERGLYEEFYERYNQNREKTAVLKEKAIAIKQNNKNYKNN